VVEEGVSAAADLGFGVRVAGNSRRRLLNRDGTFNVHRAGREAGHRLSPYHALIGMTWPRFLALLVAFYAVANLAFATAYVACGSGALSGATFAALPSALATFLRAFFFSVETFGTIGYGNVAPASLAANVVMTVESLFGLLSVALTAGLVFARFSRPTAAMIYSRYALIAPYQDGHGFMFRCANERSNQLIEARARLIYSRIELRNGNRVREFSVLPLEFDRVAFLALSWTIVHPITRSSPLYGRTARDLINNEAEFLVLLSAIDETFSQTVHSRTSYRGDEIVWNARFRPMFVETPEEGITGMDLSLIHDFEPVVS
jgi:inward rectifier potassium channel